MIRYSCHSENFGILSAEHTFSLIHDLQFDCIDIASRSLIPQNQIQADPAATSAYLKDLSQRYELPLSELFLSEVEVNGEKIKSEVDIFNAIKESIFKISIKIKNNSGQVLEYNIQPRNKILGVLLVPKMVKREDMIEINQEDLKDIINEIKNKK